MPNMRVVIDVSAADWASIPSVTREIGFPSDAQSSGNVSKLFHYLLEYWKYAQGDPTFHQPITETGQVLKDLLDPDIGLPLVVKVVHGETAALTLLQQYEELKTLTPHDPWIQLVETKEDTNRWRAALASTYQVIRGDERAYQSTWFLIDRTYNLMRALDITAIPADNSDSTGDTTTPQPPKE